MRCDETQQARIILRAKPTRWFTNTMHTESRLAQRWYRAAFTFGSITNSISFSMCWMWYWLWSVEEMKRTAKNCQHIFCIFFSSLFVLSRTPSRSLFRTCWAFAFISAYILIFINLFDWGYLFNIVWEFIFSSLSLCSCPVLLTVTISMNFSQRRFKSDNFWPNSIWFMFET